MKKTLMTAGVVIALLVGIPIIAVQIRDRSAPDYRVMRAYAVSKLDAEQLSKYREEAIAEHERDRQNAIQNDKIEQDRRRIETAKCSDFGFKEKNPELCRIPLGWANPFEPMLDSVDVRYDWKIMGVCALVATIGEARRMGCLPP